MGQDSSDATDTLLLPLVSANSDDEAERYLEELLARDAGPVIRRVINTTLNRYGSGGLSYNVQDFQDTEDLVNEVYLHLLARLRDLRSKRRFKPIASFSAYVAGASYNACNSYLRRKYPQRYRLKTRVRYILSHDDRFAIWEDRNTRWLGGLASWKNESRGPVSMGYIDHLENDAEAPALEGLAHADNVDLAVVIYSILRRASGPVEIDDIVTVTAGVLRVTDQATSLTSESGDSLELEPPQRAQAEALTPQEQGMRLERLWGEIEQLPSQQKIALLLGLRDECGDSLLVLVASHRILTMRQIALALGMELTDLASLWSDLPLDDVRIATMLGVTATKVATLRLSARRRLSRRMRFERRPRGDK